MDVEELIARESIRDLVARYNAHGDSGRYDDLLELFWGDAVVELPGAGTYSGHLEIRAMFTATADRFRDEMHKDSAPTPSPNIYVRHGVSTLVIDIEAPTRARGYAYFAVTMPHGLDHWGRYFDQYESRDGVWKFARRRAVADQAEPPPAAAAGDAGP